MPLGFLLTCCAPVQQSTSQPAAACCSSGGWGGPAPSLSLCSRSIPGCKGKRRCKPEVVSSWCTGEELSSQRPEKYKHRICKAPLGPLSSSPHFLKHLGELNTNGRKSLKDSTNGGIRSGLYFRKAMAPAVWRMVEQGWAEEGEASQEASLGERQ